MGGDFNGEQKRFLEGFTSGLMAGRAAQGLKPLAGAIPSAQGAAAGPDAAHLAAMKRFEGSGKKLADQEKWKRDEHPFDAYARFKAQAAQGRYPKPDDNFRWRFHGLFYVAPAQDSYMCRLRIPNGILNAWQFESVAALAERFGGGFADVTTRANLQIREIEARNAVAVIERLADLGMTTKGSGADNIRNVTGSSTAGIDAQELLDTRPFARAWHHHILNDRSLTGLPRKFNVAFDGGGVVATLEETNDIGFQAVEVLAGASSEGNPIAPGVWFRLVLGGITGHKDLARDTGVILQPGDAVPVADAVIRVFTDEGDRTNRNKARLKYVLDAWGFDKFLLAVEAKLGRKLARVSAEYVAPRAPVDRLAHIGVHPQKQPGLNWIGVTLPVGKLTAARMRVIAAVAKACGDGDIRLTVWQNLLISGVPDDKLGDAIAHIEACGLGVNATNVRAGLVACTGSAGCKFAAADTKADALAIAELADARVVLDTPVNIHLTGCHNSCAQHYIGDIGLIGAKVPVGDDGDTVPGYDVVTGGGFGEQASIGRELYSNIKSQDVPETVTRLLAAYQRHRAGPAESFQAFARRYEAPALMALAAEP